ncbi:MAG: hypothetical protein AB8B64_23400 [Granulosicoccus sp.]
MVNTKFDSVDLSNAAFYAVLCKSRYTYCSMEIVKFDDSNHQEFQFSHYQPIGHKIQICRLHQF